MMGQTMTTFQKPLTLRCLMLAVAAATMISTASAQFATPNPLPLPSNLSTDAFNDIGQVGYCLQLAGSNSCTANDFAITSITITNVDDACASPTDYMQVDMDVVFAKTTPTRYDVGAWFYRGPTGATDFNTQNAITGDFCIRDGVQAGLMAPGGFFTGDEDGGADLCVDVPGDAGNLEAQTTLDLILPCRDVVDTLGNGTPDGITDISACTSWANGSNDVCNFEAFQEFDLAWPNSPFAEEILPGTGSKCNCGEFDGGPLIVQVPNVNVTKSCTPTELQPGDTTTCTITITNTGLGILVGATSLGTEGFFYSDDYPENQGSVDVGSIMIMSSGSTTVDDAFTIDSTGSPTTNQALNIFPDNIAASGGTVTVVYDFITSGSLPLTETDITNTVCAAYYNDLGASDEVFNYSASETGQCATEIVTTPVNLAHFEARSNGYGQFEFDWSTATETGNLGFNIYAIMGQTRYKLNDRLIASKGIDSFRSQNYRFATNSDLVGVADRFVIEDVDRMGRRSTNGVFTLGQISGRNETEMKSVATDWQGIGDAHRSRTTQRQSQLAADVAGLRKNATLASNAREGRKPDSGPAPVPSGNSATLMLTTTETGIYRVTHADLLANGFDASGLSEQDLSLSYRGSDVPVSLTLTGRGKTFAAGSYLEFVAEAQKTLYSDESVYLLELGRGAGAQLISTISSSPRGNADTETVLRTERLARDQAYSFASPITGEPWFDTQLFAINAPASATFELDLPNLDSASSQSGQVSFSYWGGTDFADDDAEHRISFSLNGEVLGADVFDGIVERESSFSIDTAGLLSSNAINIQLPADNVNGIDLINLESIELSYPALLVASQDRIEFGAPSGNQLAVPLRQNYRVSGFSNSAYTVYAVTQDGPVKLRNTRAVKDSGVLGIRFSSVAGASRYLIATDTSVLTPDLALTSAHQLDDVRTSHLIITHPDFDTQALSDYASQTRTDFRIVNVDDIYRIYSGGNRDADAIRQFIRDVAGKSSLQSVMLVGGDTYDYHDNLGLGAISFVPTLYRQTDELIRFSAVDSLYGVLNDDNMQDVAIGRLPVRTIAELDTILAKSLTYQNQSSNRTAILAADNTESLNAYDFVSSSDSISTLLNDDGWLVETAYLDQMPVSDARAVLLNALNDGVRLAVYSGHSSSKRWTYDGLLHSTDLDQLTNAGSPFGVVQWGCWNTYFVEPTEDSLGHSFMLAGDAGAALVIGASTLTDAQQEGFFAEILHQQMLLPGLSSGEAMVVSKQLYAEQLGRDHRDILLGISLLGDPVLKLQ